MVSFSNKLSHSFAFKSGSILIIILLLVFRIALIFSYNAEIGGIDNNFVYGVIRQLAGHSIYPDPSSFPYAVNPYAPFYFNLCALFGKLFKINIDDTIQVYRLCRAVSLLCDSMTCYIVYHILRKNMATEKYISIFVAGILATILCYLGYTFSRADSLFLTFYAATFYVLLNERYSRKKAYPYFLSVLCTACIFAKQNGIILPLLIAIWFFITNNKKNLFLFILSSIALLTGTFLLYWKVISYPFFPLHIIKAIQNRIDWSWFYVYVVKRIADSLLLLPLTIAIIVSLQFVKSKEAYLKALAYIYILQLTFSIGLCLKWGSSLGYFNESFLLALLLIAIRYKQALDKYEPRLLTTAFSYLLPALLIFFLHVYLQGFLFFIHKRKEKKEAYIQQLQISNYLKRRLQGSYVFNTKNPNVDFLKNMLYKDMAVPNFDIVACCTLPDSSFDYSQLRNNLQNGKIKYVLTPKNVAYNELWNIPLRHYIKDTSLYNYDIYKYTSITH